MPSVARASRPCRAAERQEHGRDAHATQTTATKPPRANRSITNGRSPTEKLRRKLAVPSQGRLYYIRYAMKMGWTIEQIHELTNIDPWFLAQMKELVDFEDELDRRPTSKAIRKLELDGDCEADRTSC